MKTILALLLSVTSLSANIIDLTPGGYNMNNSPQIVLDFWSTEAYQTQFPVAFGDFTGWYGPCQGCVSSSPFETSPNLSISWNLANSGGFFVAYLFVTSIDLNQNFYQITAPNRRSLENYLFTIDGIADARTASIFGPFTPAPDTGSTLLLMAVALGAICFFFNYRTT